MIESRRTWNEDIGVRVRAERERQGLSLAALVEQAGFAEHYLQLFEQGKRLMSLDGFYSLCKVLNVSMDKMTGLDLILQNAKNE